ncbi:MAG: hypothetical protein AAB421_05760 [Patescibacteria group bacterium]
MKYFSSVAAVYFSGLLALTVVATFFVANPIFAEAGLAEQQSFFSNALREAHINEIVTVAGKVFRVVNGIVTAEDGPVSPATEVQALRLAYAKTVAKRSPYFALAGTSLMHLDYGLKDLAQAQERLSRIQATRHNEKIVSTTLYPLSFLRAMSELEYMRRSFIKSGADSDMIAYQALLNKAQHAYAENLEQFQRSFLSVVPETTGAYGTANSIITRENSLRALADLSRRTEKPGQAIKMRNRCFRGRINDCVVSDLSVPIVASVAKVTFKKIETDQVIRSHAFYRNFGFIVDALPSPVLSQSACTNSEKTPPFFSFSYEPNFFGYIERFGIVPIGNVRFFETDRYTQVPYLDYFTSRGARYVPAKEFNHYNCPELDRDVGSIFSTFAIGNYARQSSILEQTPPADTKVLQRSVRGVSGTTIHESDAHTYLQTALQLVDKGLLPASISDEIIDLAVATKNQSAGFEWIPTEIARIELRNLLARKKGAQPELAASFLFFARSGFYALMMSGNQSLGTVPELFTEKKHILPDEPYIYLSDFQEIPGELPRAMNDLKDYLKIHSDLLW